MPCLRLGRQPGEKCRVAGRHSTPLAVYARSCSAKMNFSHYTKLQSAVRLLVRQWVGSRVRFTREAIRRGGDFSCLARRQHLPLCQEWSNSAVLSMSAAFLDSLRLTLRHPPSPSRSIGPGGPGPTEAARWGKEGFRISPMESKHTLG